MNTKTASFKALFINCSIKPDKENSHTQRLMDRAAGIMQEEGVEVEHVYVLEHEIAFGMTKDAREEGRADDWPEIQNKIMAADILVLGTPIWLGAKSSVATQVIERMYAYSGEFNEKEQYAYYGKVAGCIVTGNEDGAKNCASEILYAMSHIGYTIPPQADAAWLGEVGPGASYGDVSYRGEKVNEDATPAGYDNEFTNKNTTYMSWNLMHMARILKDASGLPAHGNTHNGWRDATNATNQSIDHL